jgi:hypothetical protein
MINLIKKFFAFLLPILKQATAEAALDIIDDLVYTNEKRRPRTRRGYTRYNKPTVTRHENSNPPFQMDNAGYHDVVMVAFDIMGPNAAVAHEWLYSQLPQGDAYYGDNEEIRLDAWWMADDERFDGSDCDSAVFVTKGKQAEARELLRKHGLAH